MTRLQTIFASKTALAAAAFTVAMALSPTAEACNRGGGYSRPSYNTYHRPVYRAPVQHTPIYGTPAPQTVFTQPSPQVITQPAPQQQFVQQAPVQQTAPVQQAPIQTAPQQTAPVQTAPQQTAPQVNAMDAALQALGGFTPQPTTPQQTTPQQTIPAHVGTFKATLANGASVELTLDANGQFTWSAINGSGTKTSFAGSYQVGSDSLTLVRSNDNQKLAGNLTGLNTNGFKFQLGNTAAALNFVRS